MAVPHAGAAVLPRDPGRAAEPQLAPPREPEGQPGPPAAPAPPREPEGQPGPPAAAAAPAPPREPEGQARPQLPPRQAEPDLPSWPSVLATTLQLWLQRRVLRRRRSAGARMPRVLAALAVGVVLAAAAVVIAVSSATGTAPGGPVPGAGAGQIAAVTIARQQAARWVSAQVSKATIVACDPVMCSGLRGDGYPAGSLLVLGPSVVDPLGSGIVVATQAVRSLFGSRLDGVYAPTVIASFGTGAARIDVRVTAVNGSAAYLAALRADQQERQHAGSLLAGNQAMRASPAARRQLTAGQVDSRLLIMLATVAGQHRGADVLAFGDPGPGAGQGMPLRSAELAVVGTGASGRAYLQWLLAFLHQQWPLYKPASITLLHGTAVQIEFSAPSPLGLLPGGAP